ncbi:MAG: hypothetical protein H5T82_01025 [Demequina sp.]|uniref:FtsK/SpoIIIE domain-containing protein n=1 Tax=Demequina sp. TaxID=2050685 RepID=UPI0019A11765|nr:FtsK/SpoIIIE domain-containing protein [Demequina sp.]MBC7297467.1 hypothetical protein [Demequina sp.]
MLLTIARSLTDTHDVEIEAAVGARLSEVLDGTTAKRAWCGPALLEPSHRAGTYPLLHGALLRDGPGPHTATPPGLHLATIAGPDAGILIDVDDPVTLGSAPGRHQIRDDALDPTHVVVRRAASESVSFTDLGSTNGTGRWRHDGQRWRWSGRRRRFTAREGDVITVGNTAVQVRGAALAVPRSGLWRLPLLPLRPLAGLPWSSVPPWSGLPDPTAAAGWTGSVLITGPGAREAARAVILARGRRPPPPAPFFEEWLRWLPEALHSDGPVRCDPSGKAPAEATLEAHASHCRVAGSSDTAERLPMAVSQDTADTLARALAGAAAIPFPRNVRWADIDQTHVYSPHSSPLSVAAGATCSAGQEPWIVVLDDRAPHLLAAGAHGSGTSTLLATLVGGLAHRYDSRRLRIVLIGTGADGPLQPCASLPHVTSSTGNARGDDAVRVLDALAREARQRRDGLRDSGTPDWRTWEASGGAPERLLVVVDDFDLAAGHSRTASDAIDALTASSVFVGVHVALATHRPAGAITPSLRASCGHIVALHCASDSDSLCVIGVPDAAALGDIPGRAVASVAGARTLVQVALPLAEASPRVRRTHVEFAHAPHLATAVVARGRQEESDAPVAP